MMQLPASSPRFACGWRKCSGLHPDCGSGWTSCRHQQTYQHWQHGSYGRRCLQQSDRYRRVLHRRHGCSGTDRYCRLLSGARAWAGNIQQCIEDRTAWCQGRDTTAHGAVSAECAVEMVAGAWQRHRQRRSRWPSPESPDPVAALLTSLLGLCILRVSAGVRPHSWTGQFSPRQVSRASAGNSTCAAAPGKAAGRWHPG